MSKRYLLRNNPKPPAFIAAGPVGIREWQRYFFWLSTIILLSVSRPASSETRDECYRRIGKNTNLAFGGGGGGVVGTAVGVSACTGFLGAAFLDWGLSYATCVATVAVAGTVAGTATAESYNNDKERECDELADDVMEPSEDFSQANKAGPQQSQ